MTPTEYRIDKKTPLYVFGNTEYTDVLIKDFNVVGIIDDYSNADVIKGIKRFSLSGLSENDNIVSVVNNSRAFHAYQMLRDKSFTQVIFIGSLINQFPNSFQHTFLYQSQQAMKQLAPKMDEVAEAFADQESKVQFKQLVAFRQTLDLNHLSNMEVKIDQQYFESFVCNKAYQNLIDGGAFDGHDSKRFMQLFPNYNKIYLVEPQSDNLTTIKDRFQSRLNCELIHACLGSKHGQIRLSGEGTAAKISDTGQLVEMRTIDSFQTSGSTLVKLDIEGAEVDCLNGAKQALSDPKFGFAISAYHLPNDFWDIYQILKSAPVKRALYFRHYSSGFAESVMFAV